jgi:hypothetical protein
MKLLTIILVIFAVSSLARPQEDYEEEEEEPTVDLAMKYGSLGQKSSAAESPKFAPQCLYDAKGVRVNKKCEVEKGDKPKCDKGSLVATSVGDDYEMCCCNFSNYNENKK